MRPLRDSIAGLLGFVVLIAVAFAALREANDLWDCGVFGMTVLTLLVAALLAVHRHGGKRAFWLGFALFGWSCLIASLIPPVESRFLTTMGLAYLGSLRTGREVVRADDLILQGGKSFDVRAKDWASPGQNGVVLFVGGSGSPS